MKDLKKIILLLLSLTLVFAFASCGSGDNGDDKKPCVSCVDENGDEKCDVCGKEVEKEETKKEIALIEDGVANFQFILASNIDNETRRTVNTEIKSTLKNQFKINVDSFIEGAQNDKEIEIEVLIGDVTSRGEKYQFDRYSLGKEGYVIKIVDSKIIIHAGSDEQLVEAVNEFAKDILGINEKEISNVTMTSEQEKLVIQDNYKITSLKVNGTDMRGYTIAADLTRDFYREAAESIQDTLYDRTGYWFKIVDIENATDKSFVIKHVEADDPKESFKISANGSQLVMECAYDNMLTKTALQFVAQKITLGKGDIDFKDTVFKQDISVVYYEDFGAKGDGRTDDYQAIYNTHVFANISGQTVKSKNPRAEYYIFNTRLEIEGKTKVTTIPIQTNVDWCGAKFIIDDSDIASFKGGSNYDLYSSNIFTVIPNEEHEEIKFTDEEVLDAIVLDGLNPNTKHINFNIDGWDGALMIVPYNTSHKVFRRRGYSQFAGEAMHELIVIDKDGNVSEETPIMFEYSDIDYMLVYKLDPSSAVSVGNGTIETRDSEINHKLYDPTTKTYTYTTAYKARGIMVKRSYTTVHDVEHIVTGGFTLKERAANQEGSAAQGMFRAANANHVTFRDCIIPGRQSYGRHSSYNFGAVCVNKVVLERCIQSNFWISIIDDEMVPSEDYVDGAYSSMSSVVIDGVTIMMHWGIGGTNYCKNMEYIDSQISRFDAHAGLYNGKIINTNINGMELTGVGDLIIEGTTWYPYSATTPMLYLRSDYGYHWDGDITIKDTSAYLFDITSTKPTLNLANHKYSNWYYGYTCAFPNITLDNFDIYSLKNQAPMAAGFDVHLFAFKSGAKQMHLSTDAGSNTILGYVDADKDGFIDEPLYDVNLDGTIDERDRIDLDLDGKVGNTKLKMEDYNSLSSDTLESGITHPDCKRNVNIVKPPKYIKIINNDGVNGSGGYVYNIVNTYGQNISDGNWYREPGTKDTMGGFFGNTMFIYGNGENEYFLGTDHVGQNITPTFNFRDSFY